MTDTSGPTSSEPFAYYDPDSSSWKTSQGTFLWGSDEYSATWPKQGTTRTGCAYERPTSAPRTAANGSSSLLPTPTHRDPKAGADLRTGRTAGPDLLNALLPTPNAADGMGGPGHQGRDGGLNLRTAVTLLPTPSAGQHNYDEDPDQWLARRETLKARGINGNGAGLPLGVAIKLLPTPESSDATGGRRSAEMGGTRSSGAKRAVTLATAIDHSVKLLPTPTVQDASNGRNSTAGRTSWEGVHVGDTMSDVAWKWAGRSAPTRPPSTDGPPSSDDQPLPGFTTDDSTNDSSNG